MTITIATNSYFPLAKAGKKQHHTTKGLQEQKPVDHLNHAILALPHTPMYLIHKWWARKPHNVVSEYIKRYTKEHEIVLDPFCGSGVTAIEAIKLDRKAVATDLDPIASF